MARQPRIDYPGAWHHVMNRGARRAPVFNVDDHCHLFLSIVADLPHRFGVEVHAYSLMPNHFHLLLHSLRGQLSRAMRHLAARYTQTVNKRNEWDGPLFKGRFRGQVITSERHLATVAAYIHLNPIRAQLVRRLDQSSWTSHRAYLGLEPQPEWLSTSAVVNACGGATQFADLVRDYRLRRIPWPEAFRDETGWLTAPSVAGEDWSHHQRLRTPAERSGGVTPERVLARIRRITSTGAADLKRAVLGQGANAARRFAVWALAESTDLTQREIGAFVAMSSAHVANTLSAVRRNAGRLQPWIEAWEKDEVLYM